MEKLNVLAFYKEEVDAKINFDKVEILKLFASVEELNIRAIVSEYNAEDGIGKHGADVVVAILAENDIDAVLVINAEEISSDSEKVWKFMDMLEPLDVKVISVNNDLPDCNPVQVKRVNHCTVTIFEE